MDVYTENELVKGENAVEIGLWGIPYREEATISIIEITDVIESVEFSDLEKYSYLTEYYNGSIYAPQMEGETVTVTYTDGTSETLNNFDGYGYLEKSGYPVESIYEEVDGKWIVAICVAGQNMLEAECVFESATLAENLIEYKDSVFDGIQYIISWASDYLDDIFTASSLGEAIDSLINAVKYIVSDVIYVFEDLFSQTKGLIGSLI